MLLLAAGRGSRFGGDVPKAYLQCAGKTLLQHSAERLCQVADPRRGEAELIVVVHKDDRRQHLAPLLPALQALGASSFVDGGDQRQESMAHGLAAADPGCELVLVHDAARLLLPVTAARECVRQAAIVGAALLAVPVPDTLKRVVGGRVQATLERAATWQAQTPQVIRRELLERALAKARADGFSGTDDVSLVEHLGEPVAVVEGSPANLKVTRREDLALAAALLAGGRT
jgi:2-C-methyl-D-erythritol 4-phosphate cytidylyltransferase